ncbi:stage III sporulation protein AA [Oscillospiraceae bacterium MB08-C2-2]|nr:stage III sporulation protein AA [Oscillospiraceae bacterium MB08-C2-2]
MQELVGTRRFDQAVSFLSHRVCRVLLALPEKVRESAFEVRLRVGKPLTLVSGEGCLFVDHEGHPSRFPDANSFIITLRDLEDCVITLCDYSIHSHQQEFKNGFIAVEGGHRAGICGTAVVTDGVLANVRDVTSVNLRIAREMKGAAGELAERVFANGLCSVLVAGIPSSGKTTLLRDLARMLADGQLGNYYKVAVVDERCELGAVSAGLPQNDLGACCDILSGYPKGEGILTAIRTLSPQVVVCDEIGSSKEADSLLDSVGCGVKLVASAHGASPQELMRRPQLRRLLEQGAFDKVVLLGRAETPGQIVDVLEAGDLLGENFGNGSADSVRMDDRAPDGFLLAGAGSGFGNSHSTYG